MHRPTIKIYEYLKYTFTDLINMLPNQIKNMKKNFRQFDKNY